MIEQAVTFAIEAAHRTEGDPRLHGHSYLVEVWTAHLRDLAVLEAEVQSVRAEVDHSLLNDSIGGTTMEHMAAWLLERFVFLPATRVVVRRPTLGYVVEARAAR
ncbi:MAG TPA: 6-carboxytetrahydropterin synthase [Acetobacteraceae bacterium]|jgi:6-pyruvoyl-tetrahydropterin synthase|nr:6-carboxytetrahydropterin synthase [Acetobacteraceae bacterium]